MYADLGIKEIDSTDGDERILDALFLWKQIVKFRICVYHLLHMTANWRRCTQITMDPNSPLFHSPLNFPQSRLVV